MTSCYELLMKKKLMIGYTMKTKKVWIFETRNSLETYSISNISVALKVLKYATRAGYC